MKSVVLKPTHSKHKATTRKRSSLILDKENIPPSEDNYYETQPPLIATKKIKRVNSFNQVSGKATKIKKPNSKINKKKTAKELYQIHNNNVDSMTKDKKQEEGEGKSHNIVSPIITSNIDLISRRLKDNMTKVTYNVMAYLLSSKQPNDQYLYEKVFKPLKPSSTLSYNQNDRSTDTCLDIIMCSPPTENHVISFSSLPRLHQEDIAYSPIFNRSFDIDEENAFINAWLQHGSGSSEYSSGGDPNDSFSIVTEQELSDLLSQDGNFL